MQQSGSLEKAKHYIESHSKDSDVRRQSQQGPCITISREAGAGSGLIAEKLVNILKPLSNYPDSEWGIFDKNLIERVIEDHHLPNQLGKFMGEEVKPFLTEIMNEVFGIHPPLIKLEHKTTETILRLAFIGNCVIIGRGANLITAYMKNCFHIRLVAPLEVRIKNVQDFYGNSKQEAIDFVKSEDRKRNKFIEEHYHKKADDPLLYHLILNTGLLTLEEVSENIALCVRNKFKQFFTGAQ
jgi:hypothetical protein